jgi:uncharacterized membrane protein
MRTTLLPIHIIAGVLGLVFGFVALYAAKGGRLHRKSGMLFVYALVTMALIGAFLAVLKREGSSVVGGVLTAYMVITGLVTLRPTVAGSRRLHLGFMLVALAIGLASLRFSFEILGTPTGNRVAGSVLFIFGAVALLASASDLRIARYGDLRGASRLARHLWRMCFALLIAAFSFFVGQAQVIPKPIRIPVLLVIPPLVVLMTMFYWLWRVRIRRSLRGIVVVSAHDETGMTSRVRKEQASLRISTTERT